MPDFISEIKKINTDGLIYEFSKLSIDMFKNDQYLKVLEVPVLQFGIPKIAKVSLSAWDIPNIEFLSVLHSNDFRRAKKVASLEYLINLYRKYDNNHSAADCIRHGDSNDLFRSILGMTAEQFQYQNRSWIFDKLNRDYYILYAATGFEHREKIDIASIVDNTFGFSVDDYVSVLLMIFGLCGHRPDPISALSNMGPRKESSVLTKENIIHLVQCYSCSYDDLRTSEFGKQLLYSRPFIQTKREGLYLMSSLFLVAMTVANGLYWLARDFYCRQENQIFVNSFGLLFEDYIKELATSYCSKDEWKVIPQGKEKGADFVFDFGKLRMLVESKSALLRLDAKQQIPNLEATNIFFERTIKKSYSQLQSSYTQAIQNTDIPVIKVILLYDEFSNTAIIEKSIEEIFEHDPCCFVMTIREFEILLHLYRNAPAKCNSIFENILEQICHGTPHETFGGIYEKLSIFENPHLQGKIDHISRLHEQFEAQLG